MTFRFRLSHRYTLFIFLQQTLLHFPIHLATLLILFRNRYRPSQVASTNQSLARSAPSSPNFLTSFASFATSLETRSKICRSYRRIHHHSNQQDVIPQIEETLSIAYTPKASYGLANDN